MRVFAHESREEWLAWRQGGIGGSDIGAIMGVNPYKSAYEIWEEKCGLKGPDVVNAAMQRGIDNEDRVREWVESCLGFRFHKANIQHSSVTYFRASLDGIDDSRRYVLEVKCPSSFKIAEQCQQGDFPKYWLYQILWDMMVAEVSQGYLAILDPTNDEVMLSPISHYEDVQLEMVKAAHEFWNNNVIKGICPETKDAGEVEDDVLYQKLKAYKIVKEEENCFADQAKQMKDEIVKYMCEMPFSCKGFKLIKSMPRSQYDIEAMRKDGIAVEKYKKIAGEPSYRLILPKED